MFCIVNTLKSFKILFLFLQNVTPVSIRSSGPIDVHYHVAHYSWGNPGYNFSLVYSFPDASLCGSTYYNTPAGK